MAVGKVNENEESKKWKVVKEMRNEGKGDTCVLNVLKCLVGELGP